MVPLINKQETGKNLRRIMERNSISAKEVQEYLGLGCVQSVYRWLEGRSMPTIDNLYALSELFQMPMDAIVCGNRAPSATNNVSAVRSPQERRLYTYCRKLFEKYAA